MIAESDFQTCQKRMLEVEEKAKQVAEIAEKTNLLVFGDEGKLM